VHTLLNRIINIMEIFLDIDDINWFVIYCQTYATEPQVSMVNSNSIKILKKTK
jgi:hypothetical protein